MLAVLGVAVGCGTLLGVEEEPEQITRPDGGGDGDPEGDARSDRDSGQADDAAFDSEIEASCVDAASDPDNCGACGRKCNLDAGCTSGRCERFVVFVTSTTQDGAFNGTNADKRCTDLAHDAGLGGDFRVWIGGPGTANRFAPEVVAPYHRTNGERVSTKWPPGGALERPIRYDERGAQPTGTSQVWSDLYGDGSVAPSATVNNCLGWVTQAINQQGGYGESASSTAEWTRGTIPNDMPCSTRLRLYCVETP